MASVSNPKAGKGKKSFRVGRVRAFLRGRVWYLCYREKSLGRSASPREEGASGCGWEGWQRRSDFRESWGVLRRGIRRDARSTKKAASPSVSERG